MAATEPAATPGSQNASFAPYTTNGITYSQYSPAKEGTLLPALRRLITPNLSEPYSIYVYRYFLYEWPDLCFLASVPSLSADQQADDSQRDGDDDEIVGVILCKLEPHRGGPLRGYIAMLATSPAQRNKGIATALVQHAVRAMDAKGADEVALETEVSNAASLRLYQRAGFVRSKRLAQFYLNGSEAFRLVLYLRPGTADKQTHPVQWDGENYVSPPGLHELEA